MLIPFTSIAPADLLTSTERAAIVAASMVHVIHGRKSPETLRHIGGRLLTRAADGLEWGHDVSLLLAASDVFFAVADRVAAGMVPARKQAECAAFVAFAAGRSFGGHTAKAARVAASPVM